MTVSRQPRRRYDATGRQAQARENRARAIGAATELFVRQGFAATSMAQIAAAAGVSTPTVFAYFSSKINLLRVAVDEAVAGDDEPVALHERPAMRAVHDGATAGEVLGAFAVAATEIAQRAFPLLSALRRAADVDPQAGELARDLEHQRLTGAGIVAATVADRLGTAAADDVERIRDTLWTIFSPDVYGLLVRERGWSHDAYREWVTDAALGALTPDRPRTTRPPATRPPATEPPATEPRSTSRAEFD